MANEISTYKTYLMYSTTSTGSYVKLVDIVDFPDLGGEPETIDVTTLSDPNRRYILGIQDTGVMNFTANYTHVDYAKVKALKDVIYYYAVYFGATGGTPTGTNGIFKFSGYADVFVQGKGVNEAQQMTISIAPNSEITDATPT